MSRWVQMNLDRRRRFFARLVLAVTFNLLSAGACLSLESPRQARRAPGQLACETPEWQRVLAIAGSLSTDAKRQLEKVAESEDDTPARQLARGALRMWNDSEGTYYSEGPVLLKQSPLEPGKLRERLPGNVEAFVIVVTVALNESGCPEGYRVVKGEEPGKNVLELVEHSVYDSLYQPARNEEGYQSSKLTLTYLMELH